MDDLDLEGLEPTYEVFRQRAPAFGTVLPVILLLVIVAIVAGLMWGGVIQGDAPRMGPAGSSTTESTVLIVP